MEIIEVAEHDQIAVPIARLLTDGEITIDARIEKRGYFLVALAAGRVCLRATRYVGLIPLTDEIAVRVVPKATIANLSEMMIKAGNIPAFIEGFSRGYRPWFSASPQAMDIYHEALLSSAARIIERGIMKAYVTVAQPPAWRGRLLVSETVKTEIAHGVRHRKKFDYSTLSPDIPANRVLKLALTAVKDWLERSDDGKLRRKTVRTRALLQRFEDVCASRSLDPALIGAVPRLASSLPRYYRYYAEALWAAYVILQGLLPDPTQHGYVSLDSMIIDVSVVFESYVRNVLIYHAAPQAIRVRDGNLPANQPSFFADNSNNKLKPDIVVERNGEVAAILDAKYKPSIKEQDRYELLSFMEATGAMVGAFICPKVETSPDSELLGTTKGGKRMFLIRIDLGAHEMAVEERKLWAAVSGILSEARAGG